MVYPEGEVAGIAKPRDPFFDNMRSDNKGYREKYNNNRGDYRGGYRGGNNHYQGQSDNYRGGHQQNYPNQQHHQNQGHYDSERGRGGHQNNNEGGRGRGDYGGNRGGYRGRPQTGGMNDRRDEETFGALSSQNFKFKHENIARGGQKIKGPGQQQDFKKPANNGTGGNGRPRFEDGGANKRTKNRFAAMNNPKATKEPEDSEEEEEPTT